MLQAGEPSIGLRAIEQMGWLRLFPELDALRGIVQPPAHHPEGDVWTHALAAADAAARIGRREPALDPDRRARETLAALAHDLGKAHATQIAPDGQITSHGHAEAGVAPATRLLARLAVDRRTTQEICTLVREHMVHIGLPRERGPVLRLARRPPHPGSWPEAAPDRERAHP